MYKARELFEKAGILLNDTGEYADRRWPLSELCGWLNDGIGAIVLQKPSATAKSVTLSLVSGTLQSIPDGYISILRPVRNMRTVSSDRKPRRNISVVPDDQLSALNPTWHDTYSVPFAQQAKHLIFDEANPRAFYVYPGNDGTGAIELVLCAAPTKLVPTDPSKPEDLASYEFDIPLDDIYFGALLDYVLYRARSKDSQDAGSLQRAALHYQQFANALGIRINVEANTSPNVKAGAPHAAGGVVQSG